jgi:ketosteroid isomerase-like protein
LARQEAVRKGDRAALERIYADDFVGVSSNGQVVDKGGVLALLGRTDPRLTFSTDELTARLMGPVGMAMGRITARGDDGNVVFAFRFLHLYEKRDGRWVTVAGQSTSLPP